MTRVFEQLHHLGFTAKWYNRARSLAPKKGFAARGNARNPHQKRTSTALRVFVALACLALAAVLGFALVLVLRPAFAGPLLERLPITATVASGDASDAGAGGAFSAIGEQALSDEEMAALSPNPLIAQCSGVDIASPVAPADLTGVLFHQASYDYALVLETQLPEADYEAATATRQLAVNREQKGGEWLDAQALHLWRSSDATAMDTSIDVGALPGTTVRSPVTGTVALVADYMLYDEMPDIEIHIQPEGRPDLDCVLLHTTDPLVEAGDHVQAGVTPISHVRDIESWLYDVQLGFFTPEGVGGNHTHVQMNNADAPGYRETKLRQGPAPAENQDTSANGPA